MTDLLPELVRARPPAPLISFIVPVYNEEDSILLFLEAMDSRLSLPGARREYVFVNDGSRDATLALLLDAARRRDDVTVLNLSRNFGKEAAMTAGLDHARGDAVVLMDVDLQDPPEIIAAFYESWQQGYDIAYGMRRAREGETWLKLVTAKLFYRWFNRIAETPIPPNVGDFRLLDRRVVNAVRQLPERGRFMKGLLAWVGFPTVAIPFDRKPRKTGSTKWNYWRLWNFALEGIVGFSTAPLRIWTYLGLVLAAIAVLYAAYLVIRVLLIGIDVPGYASLITVLLVSSALNLISLGIIGEYVGRLFVETKQRPIYLLEGTYRQRGAGDET